MVPVSAAAVFAAISGSAPATTAAMGSIMIPAMVRAGYDKAFATAVAVSSGVLGPLIPPSIAFVIWGVIAEQSIGRLFLSGIVPGLAIVLGLLVRSEEHTSELQSLMRISYAVFCLKKNKTNAIPHSKHLLMH